MSRIGSGFRARAPFSLLGALPRRSWALLSLLGAMADAFGVILTRIHGVADALRCLQGDRLLEARAVQFDGIHAFLSDARAPFQREQLAKIAQELVELPFTQDQKTRLVGTVLGKCRRLRGALEGLVGHGNGPVHQVPLD